MSYRSSERAIVWAVIGFAGYTEFQPQWSRTDARKRARELQGKVWRISVRRVKARA